MSNLRTYWRQLRKPLGATWLPVLPPLGAFIELAAIVAMIYAACAITGTDIATLEPSPFWLPILLLSLQYGTVAGLIATGVSTLLYTLNGLPEQAIGENLFNYLLKVWALPILWIGVSLVLGQFRMRQISAKQDMKRRLDQRTSEAQSLSAYSKALEERCHRLERQITSSGPKSGAATLDVLSRFLEPSADFGAALDKVREQAFPGTRIWLLAVSPTGLDTIARVSDDEAPWPKTIDASQPLYRASVIERRGLSILSAAGESALAGLAHVTEPIFHPETGRVSGVLALEATDPSLISEDSNNRLQVVARFVALHLSEPRIVVDNTERTIHADTRVNRITKNWRQFGWQKPAGENHDAARAASGDTGERPVQRPSAVK